MKLIADKGAFGVTLRNACIAIAGFFLTLIVVGIIANPKMITHPDKLVGTIITVLSYLALLFGSLRINQWLVLIWLLFAVYYLISWPIVFFALIFNYGGYREDVAEMNVIAVLLVHLILLIVFLYCARLVLSFFVELRKPKANVQIAAVV